MDEALLRLRQKIVTMYNPQRFKSTDLDEAQALMERFPFATLISVENGEPFVSHLPLTSRYQNGRFVLVGHMARANPHWKIITSGQVKVLFHGPHTYITPRWYEKNDVPTWNFTTVHATGRATLVEDEAGIRECLVDLSTHAERLWPSGWEFFIPDDLSGPALSRGIVGFRIDVDKVDFKRKLSQRQTPQGRAGVLKGLATRPDDNSRDILNEMMKLYDSRGELK